MICTRGVVLNAVRYSDSKQVVSVFTPDEGCVSMVVSRGSGRSGGRGGGRGGRRAAVWQPLTIVEVTWQERPGRALAVPREIGVARPWVDIPYHPHKAAVAMFLGEFLGAVLRHEPGSVSLFAFIEGSLAWFDAAAAGFANFHIVMLMELSRYLGFAPNVEDWCPGAYFDLRAGEFTMSCPLHTDYLGATEAALVPRLMRLGYREMRRIGLSGTMRRRILDVVVTYYRLHVAEMPAMRSLAVLAEVMDVSR